MIDRRLDQVRAALLAACNAAIADGWTITQKVTADQEHKLCCPLAAAALSDRGVMPDTCVLAYGRMSLGLSDTEAIEFALGFDDGDASDCAVARLGREFSQLYCGVKP